MGMTIDEDIEMLEYIRQDFMGCRQGVALQDAINTMRKYQQIEQILHNGFGKGVYAVFDEIVKVVEDGNDD